MLKSDQIYRTFLVIIFSGSIIFPMYFLILDSTRGEEWVNFPSTLEYVPAFIATMMGVFVALLLEAQIERRREEDTMIQVQNIIEKELLRGVEYLKKEKGNLVVTMVWDSLINSGRASYLPLDVQNLLFDIYSEIQSFNYEAMITRQVGEEFKRAPSAEKKQEWIKASNRILVKEKQLRERLESFLSMQVLSSGEESDYKSK